MQTIALDTRKWLLEAAGEVFSEVGFRQATVREIVRRAGGANVAAINYHFGDKGALYAAVLQHFAVKSVQQHPPHGGLRAAAPPEEQLRAFVLSFLRRVFDSGHQAVHGRLMAREMIEPTAALDRIVEQVIRPMYGQLCAIVKTIGGPALRPGQVALAAKSVVGQCLFYKHCAPVIQRLEGPLRTSAADVEALADHITAFSLEAIRGLGRRKGKGGR